MFLFQSKEEVEEQSRAERWQVGRHRREEERKRLGRKLGERWLVKQSSLWRGSSSVGIFISAAQVPLDIHMYIKFERLGQRAVSWRFLSSV